MKRFIKSHFLSSVPPWLNEKMNDVPRVLHLVISLEHGGLERLVVDWTNERNRRHPGSTAVCCLDREGDLADKVEGDAVYCLNANRSKFPWDRKTVSRLCGLLHGNGGTTSRSSADRQEPVPPLGRFEIIHTHNLAAQQYGVLAARKAGIRHIYSQHGTNIHNLGWKDRVRSKVLCAMTDSVVAVSESVKKAMIGIQGISEKKIMVIRNGVETGNWKLETGIIGQQVRGDLGIGAEDFVIGSVGRLARVKGYDRLILAFEKIISRRGAEDAEKVGQQQQLQLLLIGDGEEREHLERQAKDLGVREKVIFAGFQEDVDKYYAAMDLFVLPSRSEGLSVALLEAMAAGVPVAVTDVGDCREIIDNAAAGLLLPDDQGQWAPVISKQLARRRPVALARQAVSSNESAQIVEKAKARVREKYSIDQTLEAYESLYKELAHGSKR